jgi:hypothetical protein
MIPSAEYNVPGFPLHIIYTIFNEKSIPPSPALPIKMGRELL